MARYIKKGFREAFDDPSEIEPDKLAMCTFEVEPVEEDTTINTVYGKILVTAGNFIMTDYLGNRVGITPNDLDNQYDKD